MISHEVKCWPEFWSDLKIGKKTFECRRNDRNYQVGDELVEREWDPQKHEYVSAEVLRFTITYVLNGPIFGLRKGYCILGLSRVHSGAHEGRVTEEKIQSVAFAAAHNVCDFGSPDATRHNCKTIAQAIRDALS